MAGASAVMTQVGARPVGSAPNDDEAWRKAVLTAAELGFQESGCLDGMREWWKEKNQHIRTDIKEGPIPFKFCDSSAVCPTELAGGKCGDADCKFIVHGSKGHDRPFWEMLEWVHQPTQHRGWRIFKPHLSKRISSITSLIPDLCSIVIDYYEPELRFSYRPIYSEQSVAENKANRKMTFNGSCNYVLGAEVLHQALGFQRPPPADAATDFLPSLHLLLRSSRNKLTVAETVQRIYPVPGTPHADGVRTQVGGEGYLLPGERKLKCVDSDCMDPLRLAIQIRLSDLPTPWLAFGMALPDIPLDQQLLQAWVHVDDRCDEGGRHRIIRIEPPEKAAKVKANSKKGNRKKPDQARRRSSDEEEEEDVEEKEEDEEAEEEERVQCFHIAGWYEDTDHSMHESDASTIGQFVAVAQLAPRWESKPNKNAARERVASETEALRAYRRVMSEAWRQRAPNKDYAYGASTDEPEYHKWVHVRSFMVGGFNWWENGDECSSCKYCRSYLHPLLNIPSACTMKFDEGTNAHVDQCPIHRKELEFMWENGWFEEEQDRVEYDDDDCRSDLD